MFELSQVCASGDKMFIRTKWSYRVTHVLERISRSKGFTVFVCVHALVGVCKHEREGGWVIEDYITTKVSFGLTSDSFTHYLRRSPHLSEICHLIYKLSFYLTKRQHAFALLAHLSQPSSSLLGTVFFKKALHLRLIIFWNILFQRSEERIHNNFNESASLMPKFYKHWQNLGRKPLEVYKLWQNVCLRVYAYARVCVCVLT